MPPAPNHFPGPVEVINPCPCATIGSALAEGSPAETRRRGMRGSQVISSVTELRDHLGIASLAERAPGRLPWTTGSASSGSRTSWTSSCSKRSRRISSFTGPFASSSRGASVPFPEIPRPEIAEALAKAGTVLGDVLEAIYESDPPRGLADRCREIQQAFRQLDLADEALQEHLEQNLLESVRRGLFSAAHTPLLATMVRAFETIEAT